MTRVFFFFFFALAAGRALAPRCFLAHARPRRAPARPAPKRGRDGVRGRPGSPMQASVGGWAGGAPRGAGAPPVAMRSGGRENLDQARPPPARLGPLSLFPLPHSLSHLVPLRRRHVGQQGFQAAPQVLVRDGGRGQLLVKLGRWMEREMDGEGGRGDGQRVGKKRGGRGGGRPCRESGPTPTRTPRRKGTPPWRPPPKKGRPAGPDWGGGAGRGKHAAGGSAAFFSLSLCCSLLPAPPPRSPNNQSFPAGCPQRAWRAGGPGWRPGRVAV